jgi:hypothetical protein
MHATYPTKYRDKHGEEVTSIRNDGKTLSMVVRGVEFQGSDLDSFEPVGSQASSEWSSFTFQLECLCSCVIEAEIPMPVVDGDRIVEGSLAVHLELGDPKPKGGIDREVLTLSLRVEDRVFASRGTSGWFEDELADIERQMPKGSYMKCCYTCAFSDYSPAGHGLFGGLACFRDNKQGYLSVKGKRNLFAIWNTMTEFVQETYWCPEFSKRKAGTGYRR